MRMVAGSMTINTRVTRRSQETPTLDKINTSEYFQQIFETPGRPQAKVYACLIPVYFLVCKQFFPVCVQANVEKALVLEHYDDVPESIVAGHCSMCKGFWLHSFNVCKALSGLAYDALPLMQAVHAVAASCDQLLFEQHMF